MRNNNISQREAVRLRKRVGELEEILRRQQNRWSSEWPMGTHLGDIDVSTLPKHAGRIETARLLRHAVVVTIDGDAKMLNFFALPIAGAKP